MFSLVHPMILTKPFKCIVNTSSSQNIVVENVPGKARTTSNCPSHSGHNITSSGIGMIIIKKRGTCTPLIY